MLNAEELHFRYKQAEKLKQYARLLDYCGATEEETRPYHEMADYQMREVRLSWGKF